MHIKTTLSYRYAQKRSMSSFSYQYAWLYCDSIQRCTLSPLNSDYPSFHYWLISIFQICKEGPYSMRLVLSHNYSKKHLADKDSSSDWQLLIVVKWLDCPDCTDTSFWINQGMLSMPLFHPLFWLFCTMQPFVLTCTCHLHFMIIHAEMPIH